MESKVEHFLGREKEEEKKNANVRDGAKSENSRREMRETATQFEIKNLEVNNGKTSFSINPIKKGREGARREYHGGKHVARFNFPGI